MCEASHGDVQYGRCLEDNLTAGIARIVVDGRCGLRPPVPRSLLRPSRGSRSVRSSSTLRAVWLTCFRPSWPSPILWSHVAVLQLRLADTFGERRISVFPAHAVSCKLDLPPA